MDKVKQFLEFVRKHHFWILCGLVACIGLIVLMMSTGKLAAETESRKRDIEGKKSAVQGITAPWPNETWNEGMGENTAQAREYVRAAWTILYQHQKDNVYKWPATLNKNFLTDIARVEDGKQQTLKESLRVHYQNMVLDFAHNLPKIVDAVLAVDQMANGAPIPGPMQQPMFDEQGNPIFEDHRVVWDQQSQQDIFETFTWIEAPSTAIVQQAQEELWVYEALCKVIAEVNKDSKGSHDAPITGIHEMAIAYLAQNASVGGMMAGNSQTQRVIRVKQGQGLGMGAGGEEMAAGGVGPPPMMPGLGGEAGAGGAAPDPKTRCKGDQAQGLGRGLGVLGEFGAAPSAAVDPAAGGNPDDVWKGYRYVDQEGKPLATAAEVDSSPLEFNLMPFRVQLTINPKEIDRLLVAFRNSDLPLEVREVRVGEVVGTSGSFGGGGMRGLGGGGGIRPRGGMGLEGEFGPPRRMPQMPAGPGANGMPGMPQQKTVPIEVSGVAYLMKKPDPTKLESTAPTDGGAMPTDTATPMAPSPSAALPMKSEIRSTKFEINSKHEIQNRRRQFEVAVLNFEHSRFVSDFGFRISDFASVRCPGTHGV